LTEEEEYHQPWFVDDIKRVSKELEELKQLKTKTQTQLVEIKEKADMLVQSIKDADKRYPGWRQLDYYRKLAIVIVTLAFLLTFSQR
jgi:hypothetical protein